MPIADKYKNVLFVTRVRQFLIVKKLYWSYYSKMQNRILTEFTAFEKNIEIPLFPLNSKIYVKLSK